MNSENVSITIKDGPKSEVSFCYVMNCGNKLRPSILNAKVKNSSGKYKWAFLQVYKEETTSLNGELTVDSDPCDPKCPPYYSSYDGPFGGVGNVLNFSDKPSYNFEDSGKIIFYTMFSEILETDQDPKKQKYMIKGGVSWGIEKGDDGIIRSSQLHIMDSDEFINPLNTFKKMFKDACFL